MSLMKTKLFSLAAVIICMVILCVPAFAADDGDDETLTVNAAWVDGDMIRIAVTNANGENTAFALRLTDYVTDAENSEYISIQAVDLAGNKSDVIQIKNPFYVPPAENAANQNEIPDITVEILPSESTESAVPDGKKPFTPDGSGTVMDNVADNDGKEFFTVKTDDGNVFYLIVDRHRNSDNVYLLNAVTEEDLIALAQKKGKPIENGGVSAIPASPESNTANEPAQITTAAAAETTEPEAKPQKKGGINGMYILIGIAALGALGAGYYFKIIKGKKNPPDADYDDSDDNYGNEPDDNNEDDYDGGDLLDEKEDNDV